MQTSTESSSTSKGFYTDLTNPDEPDGSESFTLVSRKRKNRNRKNNNQNGNTIIKKVTPEEKLERTLAELRSDSKWLETCIRIIRDAVASLPSGEFESVLCLGLGSPSESTQARFQLCFLLELRDTILPRQARIEAFDPVFSPEDKQLLTSLGIEILQEDKQGKHALEGATLAYMPHCDRELYENFLQTNWRPQTLSNLLLIGNDLRGYIESIPTQKLGEESPCIARLGPLLASTPIPQHSVFPNAFSITTIQHIDSESLTNCDFFRGSGIQPNWLKTHVE